MSEHQFSNQKSALEEYFESLLSDVDEAEQQVSVKSKKVVESEVYTTADEEISSDIDDTPAIESQTQKTDFQPRPEPELPKRSSVADMLASIEEKVKPKEESTVSSPEFAEPAPAISMPLPDVAPAVETRLDTETETLETTEQVPEEPVTATELVVESEPASVQEPVLLEPTVPEWAESPFQCLLFKVGGLSLAVPLIKLNGVIPWSENIVETPNQTDWYLGVLMNHGAKVQVIDTAIMVLPPEHRVDMTDDPAERLSHILLVDDQRWGLACESIGEVIWLKQDEIKWRCNKTKRPWLMGTAINHMCAVMDTAAFADMLQIKS